MHWNFPDNVSKNNWHISGIYCILDIGKQLNNIISKFLLELESTNEGTDDQRTYVHHLKLQSNVESNPSLGLRKLMMFPLYIFHFINQAWRCDGRKEQKNRNTITWKRAKGSFVISSFDLVLETTLPKPFWWNAWGRAENCWSQAVEGSVCQAKFVILTIG